MSRFVKLSQISYAPIAVFTPYSVRHRLRWWNEVFPMIRPYYAIKSMDHRLMLETTAKSGLLGGFDVASAGEIEKVAKYGYPIIHSNPVKTYDDIRVAVENDVEYHVCDDIDSIHQVKSIVNKAKIVWRIQSMENYSRIRFNEKFGASLEQTIHMLENVPYTIHGISFHVGSSCSNMQVFPKMIEYIEREIFPWWIRNQNRLPGLIDIGGGFKTVDAIRSIKEPMWEFTYRHLRNHGIRYIAEPGRYLSDDSIVLYTKVIAVKKRNCGYDVYINDSVYQSFSCITYDKYTPTPVEMYTGRQIIECTIWGNTCDSADKIIGNTRLMKPEVGDILRWDNMGAYTIVSCTGGFNGFPKPTIVSTEDMTNIG